MLAEATKPAFRAAQRPPRDAHLYRAGECARGGRDRMYEVCSAAADLAGLAPTATPRVINGVITAQGARRYNVANNANA